MWHIFLWLCRKTNQCSGTHVWQAHAANTVRILKGHSYIWQGPWLQADVLQTDAGLKNFKHIIFVICAHIFDTDKNVLMRFVFYNFCDKKVVMRLLRYAVLHTDLISCT